MEMERVEREVGEYGRTAAELATMTTTPLSPSGPSGGTLARYLQAIRVILNVPVRLTSIAKFHVSSE